MKRSILRISLLMLLGVVTSVAVAWACVWLDVQRGKSGSSRIVRVPDVDEYDSEGDRWTGAYSDRRVAGLRIIVPLVLPLASSDDAQTSDGRWPPWSSFHSMPAEQMRLLLYQHMVSAEIAAGWPLPALRAQMRPSSAANATGLAGPQTIDGGLAAGAGKRYILPYDPYWPGLLANTLVFGSAWWAMLFGPGVVIRWRRRRAGRCVKCGYDLRGTEVRDQTSEVSVVCPECGAPLA